MNFEQIVRYTLEYSNQIRYYHWQTKSFAQHEALGKFYEGISGTLDTLVEIWSGRLGNIKVDQGSVELVDYTDVESVIESAEALRQAWEDFGDTIKYGDVKDQIDDLVSILRKGIELATDDIKKEGLWSATSN